jgi:hypothetical protein
MRERLPNRRASLTLDFEHAGLRYGMTVSRFTDGRPAEVFLNNHKHDSASDMWARDTGIITSLALQYGAPIEVLRDAIGRDRAGKPTSPVGVALDMMARS